MEPRSLVTDPLRLYSRRVFVDSFYSLFEAAISDLVYVASNDGRVLFN
jgi:hypothetical protein